MSIFHFIKAVHAGPVYLNGEFGVCCLVYANLMCCGIQGVVCLTYRINLVKHANVVTSE